ncbi:MAG: hypothetical protein L3K23_07165 [Thermoplasmata archaeon]|nr:hypothetical protein [Thermoplasmata archaeon]
MMEGGHCDELPGEDVESGYDPMSLSPTFSVEQSTSDASVGGLLLSQVTASVDVGGLDRSDLGKGDLDWLGALHRINLDAVERRLVRVERQDARGTIRRRGSAFEIEDHPTFADVQLFEANFRGGEALSVVGG